MREQHTLCHSKLWSRHWPDLWCVLASIGTLTIREAPGAQKPLQLWEVPVPWVWLNSGDSLTPGPLGLQPHPQVRWDWGGCQRGSNTTEPEDMVGALHDCRLGFWVMPLTRTICFHSFFAASGEPAHPRCPCQHQRVKHSSRVSLFCGRASRRVLSKKSDVMNEERQSSNGVNFEKPARRKRTSI